jgi:EF-P beta-lysylation protein EpmB
LNWQKILAQGFQSSKELLQFLELDESLSNTQIEKQFPTRVPLGFANRMQKGNVSDPLLLQVLATQNELSTLEGYTLDPLEELVSIAEPGLIHKYHGRVLLTLTGACAVHCRYCFRRHFPYTDNNPGRQGWKKVLNYVKAHTDIHEVILSGGDPLLVADSVLQEVIQEIEAIAHVKTVRIHTRIPIVLPERITEPLLRVLSESRLKKVVVFHCNHPQEIDATVVAAAYALKDAGCHLLNQSVLLANINDNAETLAALSHALFEMGTLPYYLHLLDKVQGAAHFDSMKSQALLIYQQLQSLLPGYLVPRLVREEPQKTNKTLVYAEG